MSLTLETYTQDNIYIELLWDKYSPHYHCFVGRNASNGLISTIKDYTYSTIEEAKRCFKRQVARTKKGEIQ